MWAQLKHNAVHDLAVVSEVSRPLEDDPKLCRTRKIVPFGSVQFLIDGEPIGLTPVCESGIHAADDAYGLRQDVFLTSSATFERSISPRQEITVAPPSRSTEIRSVSFMASPPARQVIHTPALFERKKHSSHARKIARPL